MSIKIEIEKIKGKEMTRRLTVEQASNVGNKVQKAHQASIEVNQKIYDEVYKFKYLTQTMILISEIRQYLNILENDIIKQRLIEYDSSKRFLF